MPIRPTPTPILACLALLAVPSVAGAGTAAEEPARPAGKRDSPPARQEPGRDSRQSLQELLARLRRMREEKFGELRGVVDQLLRVMESEALTRRMDGLADAKSKLVELGGEAAALAVDAIDPGEKPTDAVRLRAAFVTLALIEQRAPGVTTRLIEIARGGSPEGRVNAVKALAAAPDPDRASPVLYEICQSSQGELRRVALAGLARIGGPENETRLAQSLADASPEVVRLTLEALAVARAGSFASRVQKLLSVPHDAVQYIDGLLAYYRACPDVVDRASLVGLVRLAQDFSVSTDNRVRLLDTLAVFADKFDNEVRKEVRAVSESPTREVREAALVLLVVAGDKNARKDLLTDYDGQIERNKNWANSYEARANILYRIGEYRDAIRDYTKALQLSANDFRARQDEAYMGLARCYMQQGKLKEAAATLEKAPISLKQLGDLANEPVFRKLVDHAKYGNVFKVK